MKFGEPFFKAWLVALCIFSLAPGVMPYQAFAQDDVDWKYCKSDNDTPEVRAIADCTELIDADSLNESDRAKAYYRRGAAYWRKEDLNDAINDESRSIELNPEFADAYMRRGASYYRNGDYEHAIADDTKAIEIDPKNAQAYSDRSLARWRLGHQDGAAADALKAIDIDPRFSSAYLVLAMIYESKFGQAVATYELKRAAAIEPKGGFDGYRVRAEALERSHNFSGAMTDLDRWVESCPQSAVPYVYRGEAYARIVVPFADQTGLKGLDLAIADFNKALEIDPKYERALRRRGMIHMTKSELDEAIVDFTAAIELDPNNKYDYRSRAGVFMLRGDYDRAISDFSKIIELDGRDVEAYRSRVKAYDAEGDYDQAIRDLSKLIEINPEDDHAYWSRSLIYKKNHDEVAALSDSAKWNEIARRKAEIKSQSRR